jgi:hypothetical protein
MKHAQKARRTCSTLTEDVWRWAAWRVNAGCPPVAIERTGVYWQPVCPMLAGLMAVRLVYARHGKAVPGHTTEARARAWLADLRRPGRRTARCMPPRHRRDRRARTRSRARVLRAQIAVAKRLQQGIARGTSKRGQGASEALGVRGRAMVRALAAGATEATTRADVARKSFRPPRHVSRGPRPSAGDADGEEASAVAVAHRMLVMVSHMVSRRTR